MLELLSKRTATALAVSASFLSACVSADQTTSTPAPTYSSPDLTRSGVIIKMPTEQKRLRFISATVSKLSNNGPHAGYPAQVDLMVSEGTSYTSSNVFLSPLNRETAEKFAATYGSGENSSLAFMMGQDIARQTVCQGRKVTRNTVGRQYTAPTKPGPILGQPIPKGAVGRAIPAAEFSRFGWSVNLWCR
ncbi:hypothetical protein VWZ88_13170 [Phaeobacter sp. JH20_36]|uniref:hypothetical protein n=1 Tax=Phaeobacter TaxID=302485 RepID=UPI000CA381EF|nr:hypothetical protein [Phaeobacter inhibens]AUQ46087.1 hypothetical protein PhaeoP10_01749 [Phaeobacter inhibens]